MDAPLAEVVAQALEPDDGPAHASDEALLDAALAEVAERGSRGATMDAVARRAGLSRITAFRRFGSKDALLERLAVREVRRFLDSVERTFAEVTDPAERVVEAFVACVRVSHEHPLVARLARREPGVALERLTKGTPSPLELGRLFVAGHVAADRRAAGRPDADADAQAVADVLVRLALSYVLVPSPVVDLGDDAAVRAFARRHLAPLVAAR